VSTATTAIGVSDDQVKFLLEVFACYPIALLWRRIPVPALKHLFSIFTSIWLCNFMVSYQWIHTLFLALLCYVLLLIVGPKQGRYVIFVVAMGYLSGLHIYRMRTDYMGWKFDVTTQVMVMVQRLTAFAFNYYDGAANPQPREMPDKGFYEISNGVKKLPNILTFLGWMYMPAVFPMGPFVEFNHFLKVVNNDLKPSTSAVGPSMKCLVIAVACLGVNQVGTPLFNVLKLREADFVDSHSGVYIYFYVLISAFFLRNQYYFGFKIAEGAAILSGLGYAGKDKEGKDKWDASCGMDILGFEFATSYQMSSACWNMQTSVWLKRYIYFRAPRGNIALYATYAVSAFWHGFYPGYYIFFITTAGVTDVHRRIQTLVSPYFEKSPALSKLYLLISVVATVCSVNYFVVSFIILDAGMTFKLFSAMGWFLHWIVLAAFVVLYSWGMLVKKPAAIQVVGSSDKTK